MDDWQCEFDRVSSHNTSDETHMLANVVSYLSEVARARFDNHEMNIDSWDLFNSANSTSFVVSSDRQWL